MRLMEPFPMLCTDRLVLREFAWQTPRNYLRECLDREGMRTLLVGTERGIKRSCGKDGRGP